MHSGWPEWRVDYSGWASADVHASLLKGRKVWCEEDEGWSRTSEVSSSSEVNSRATSTSSCRLNLLKNLRRAAADPPTSPVCILDAPCRAGLPHHPPQHTHSQSLSRQQLRNCTLTDLCGTSSDVHVQEGSLRLRAQAGSIEVKTTI